MGLNFSTPIIHSQGQQLDIPRAEPAVPLADFIGSLSDCYTSQHDGWAYNVSVYIVLICVFIAGRFV